MSPTVRWIAPTIHPAKQIRRHVCSSGPATLGRGIGNMSQYEIELVTTTRRPSAKEGSSTYNLSVLDGRGAFQSKQACDDDVEGTFLLIVPGDRFSEGWEWQG